MPPMATGHGDLAYVVFTSGSTGVPKAVQVEHGALLAYCDALFGRIAPVTPRSFGLSTTLAADLGNTCVFGALLSGARLDIYDRDVVLDTTALAEELQRHPVDCLKYTPSQLAALAAGDHLSAVLPQRLLLLGGEVFPSALAVMVADARPGLVVYNHYGPSEATVGVVMNHV
ncbi:MAG: hypothetical protein CSA58_00290 [Micrococcales bacterium]|nr:MAG: hypothetical protein CSB46_07295 [Micrococcales bacterium]PIE28202.1 MAG: hypothetical protein CSA58_00290 [Micrococcales bacterium]